MRKQRNKRVSPRRPNIWVVRNDEKFAVREEGRSAPLIRGLTEHSAERIARTISQEFGSELILQGENGQIRDRDSHGRDPFPPRG